MQEGTFLARAQSLTHGKKGTKDTSTVVFLVHDFNETVEWTGWWTTEGGIKWAEKGLAVLKWDGDGWIDTEHDYEIKVERNAKGYWEVRFINEPGAANVQPLAPGDHAALMARIRAARASAGFDVSKAPTPAKPTPAQRVAAAAAKADDDLPF